MLFSYSPQAQWLCCLSPAHRHPRTCWKHAWASQEQAAEIIRSQNKLQVPAFNGQKQLVSLQRAGCPSALCPWSGYPQVLPGPTLAAVLLETWPCESWGCVMLQLACRHMEWPSPDTDPKHQGSPPQSGNRGTGEERLGAEAHVLRSFRMETLCRSRVLKAALCPPTSVLAFPEAAGSHPFRDHLLTWPQRQNEPLQSDGMISTSSEREQLQHNTAYANTLVTKTMLPEY